MAEKEKPLIQQELLDGIEGMKQYRTEVKAKMKRRFKKTAGILEFIGGITAIENTWVSSALISKSQHLLKNDPVVELERPILSIIQIAAEAGIPPIVTTSVMIAFSTALIYDGLKRLRNLK